jgi:RNA polymerase sigma-70 factor, ECF subfamily
MIAGRSQQSDSLPGASAAPMETQEWVASDADSNGRAHLLTRHNSNSADDISGLFDRYSRLVLVTAYRVLGDRHEAEDVVQEVFLYLHLKWHLFDPLKGSIKRWILQIAVSRALDRKLQLARRGFYGAADIESLHLPERRGSLEQQIEARLNRKHIQRAFSNLTYMQRKTLHAFFFEDLNLRDISEQLRQPLGSVRHHLYRGLERLRKNALLGKLY